MSAFADTAFSTDAFDPSAFSFAGVTPTPTPTVSLPGAGNAAGEGMRWRPGSTYTDITRWTRKGDPTKVHAIGVRRIRQSTDAVVRIVLPGRKLATAIAALTVRARSTASALIAIRPITLSASGVERAAIPGASATARTTDRQDLADVITIIELFGDDDLDD